MWLEVTQSTQTVGIPGIRGFILIKEKLDPLTTGMCRGLLFMAEESPVLFASIFLHAEQSQGMGYLSLKNQLGIADKVKSVQQFLVMAHKILYPQVGPGNSQDFTGGW